MGHFLAATAIRTESVTDIAKAISQYVQSHDVKHELLPGSTTLNDGTDVQLFAPINDWAVVLWPNYFNIHDFPLVKSIASTNPWFISAVHVYDGDYWEHLAVIEGAVLHSFCSRPNYWGDEPAELERIATFNPIANALATTANVPVGSLTPYLVDADSISEDTKAHPGDRFPLCDFWVFTDFWRQLGITYPDPPENPASVIRLSKWFSKRLPEG